ncbi:hypothetical protein [Caproiciproducens sp. MSJ-32]|uniref:hypothetical protein n=1 Tax=Caproiciproducens sp. MSJ-32 TaxID=2841527 RepID=UPI001C119450|nr:hypothetical protein [Caproiciproducens sp. MSJ-32]MBU5454177.1 hypothetical protein [Caproiciproducens sp. MSJ-32]
MDVIIYKLVENYIEEKVTDELKDEFINAAIHFNINNDVYKLLSPIEIEYKINKITSGEIKDYVELCSVYGYILFRLVKDNTIKEEDRIEALQIILEINNTITNYIRGIIEEGELFDRLTSITDKLKLTKEENQKIIDKLNS